jgi:1-acyl-sn-glycerol-3-phosphate acyltransferase
MPQRITQAQPPLTFIPPRFNRWVFRVLRVLLPALMKHSAKIQEVRVQDLDRLVNLYQQFQAGDVRMMFAFRHPSTNDPFCLGYLFSTLLPQAARRQRLPLKQPIHVHFIYDRGIPLWAGKWVGWLYSQLGGIPIQRGKVDRLGLKTARSLFANGRFPLLAAPEGATNGHGDLVSPLEPGIAQMGFWCAEDLYKAGRAETVLIVPIGIQYQYIEAPWDRLNQVLTQLETITGIHLKSTPCLVLPGEGWSPQEVQFYQRLYCLGEHILGVMEAFYARFYHQVFSSTEPEAESPQPPNTELSKRLQRLLDKALQVAEQYFELSPKGSLIDRCRRLEQAGWDWIYREDLEASDSLSLLEQGLADTIATEASLRMWHMRLVESFVAVTGKYVREKPTVERFAETTLLLWDLITRIQGGNPFARPVLGPQRATITIAEPISISDRWPTYQRNRRSAKQAVMDLTQDLQITLEKMIT